MTDSKSKRFELLYRPETFPEVLGQKPIVDELSALIRRGKLRRHLLLAGDRGSGKTSLVRLYAKALSCESNLEDGSPCGACAMCRAEIRKERIFTYDEGGLFEYDSAASGNDKDAITYLLRAVRGADIASKKRIVFFDEAHALDQAAQDSILKALEDDTDDLTFCFATTAPRKLTAALRSRLWVYTVRALPDGVAFSLLRRVAEEQNVSIDLEAIALLAAVKRNYPRDLLIGLGQMASEESHITTGSIKSAFGVDQVDFLQNYFTAIAHGNRAEQTEIFAAWNEPVLTKANWIVTFLVSLFYNNVLGLNRVIDPLIHAATDAHGALVEIWAARLGLNERGHLRRFFEQLLLFWSANRPRDESTAVLSVALFEALADRVDPLGLPMARKPLRFSQSQSRPSPNVSISSHSRGDRPQNDQFVSSKDVHLIVNRASAYAQHYGRYFNVQMEIDPISDTESIAIQEIRAFCDDFGRTYAAAESGGPHFAAIGMIDREQGRGVFASLSAFIKDDAYDNMRAELAAYIDGYGHRVDDISVDFRIVTHNAASLEFHWDGIARLCAGFEEGQSGGRRRGEPGLLDNIGFKRRRPARPIRGDRLILLGAVTDEEIDRAQELKMGFLSAIDDRAFDWVRKGWEAAEANVRQQHLAERHRLIAEAEEAFGDDPSALRRKIAALLDGWASDAKLRVRKRQLWWSERHA